jgi:phospholipid/cholesterol/gamma-HCH transport system substrate-binding protein
MNNGRTLSKLVSDEKWGLMIDSTMTNVKTGTKGLNEVIEAAKHNFLLRGYFNKEKKPKIKKLEGLEDLEENEMKKELNMGKI